MDTAVVIVAGGRGKRASGGAAPKQYRALGCKPVLTRAVEKFITHGKVDAVQAVIHGDDRSLYEDAVKAFAGQLPEPVLGGATRQDSVRAGLESLAGLKPRNILIHDAARPFVDHDLIGRVIGALGDHGAVVPALAVSDTLKQAAHGFIEKTLSRSNLWAVQTPQGFHYEALLEAHRAAKRDGMSEFTDDSSLAEWRGIKVALVEGAPANFKLTTEADFTLARERLHKAGAASSGECRIGQGFDVHAFCDGDHVKLCGLRIPHDKSLSGHSDADVGLHAATDALLGAIGDGDIGAHFPPSDPQWKNAASDHFLRHAGERVRARGARIVNLDITLICEAPKIGPHREGMRTCIADILEIEPEQVSVKATTTEGLGFTGRGEGIAAQATAMIQLG